MIATFLLLFTCQILGEMAARALGLPLPGPVAGLVLMLGLLVAVPRAVDLVRPTIAGLLSCLSLLFVPAGVGIVAYLDEVQRQGLALAVTLIGSTVIAMAVTALVFRAVARLTGNGT
ncbi:CidA/LrgA family protein [Falsirhodobacter halotolerans]|uniref:CidA/LrgA family protein n=1 Tax=Falsirhodobacter halotolerans TaxID=1146892 RepID=UPI001FD4C8E5|nr:CidA/LrgA family protein [Falsirhodobacter halotolerans]MCJ8140649.1 CidA/LrgA family protein [Falsirhodobacter halotolerans]